MAANTKNIWAFDPRSAPGCVLWLDAADSSTLTPSESIQWRDKSVEGNNATSYIGTPSLDTSGINGRQAILFNGSSSISGAISAANTNTITIFFIGSLITPFNTFAGLLCFGNPSEFDYDNDGSLPITMYINDSSIYAARNSSSQVVPISNGVPFMYVLQYDGTYINSWLNGTVQAPTDIPKTGTFTYTEYVVANRAGATGQVAGWSGHIGEILVFQSSLSTTERQRVEGYLAWKWGLNSSLISSQPFKSIRPFARYFNLLDMGTPEYWFDASDATSISASNFFLITLLNKGSFIGKNITSSVSDSCYTGKFQSNNGNNLINIPSGQTLRFDGLFPNPARSRFIVTKQGNSSSIIYMFQEGTSFSGNDAIGSDGNSLYEVAQGNLVTLQTDGSQVPSPNSFSLITFVNSIDPLDNRIRLNGLDLNFNSNSYSALSGGYRTSEVTTYIYEQDLGEFISFNSALTVAQQHLVEGYLAWKWGLYASLPSKHPYAKFPPTSPPQFIPTNISQCVLWLDGADPAGNGVIPVNDAIITSWFDKSLSSNTCTNSSSGNSPIFKRSILNGLPVLSFTGQTSGTQWLDNTVLAFPNVTNTIFAVVYNDNSTTKSPTGNNYIISARVDNRLSYSSYTNNLFATFIGSGSNWNDLNTNSPSRNMNGVWSLTAMTLATNTLTPYFNGTAQNTKSGTMGTATGFVIGDAPPGFKGQCWNGFIAEIIMYNKVLTTIERQKVEGYLASKWNLQKSLPSTHPYKLFQPAQESFNLIVPGTISSVTLSNLSGSGGTINWTESTNAVGYNWFVGTGSGSGQVATGTITSGSTLTTSVSFAFVISTNYFAWVVPYSATGTNGATTTSAAASYAGSTLVTTTGAGSINFGAGSQIIIECWGGGGGSKGQDQSNGAGAGGAYARTTISQAAAFTLFFTVGAGGTGSSATGTSGSPTWARIGTNSPPTNSTQGAQAAGGNGSGFTSPNNSTQAANSIGQVIYIGGAGGGAGAENGGGGSASSAGNGNNGTSGNGTAGGASGPGGGAGGAGGGSSFSGQDGISNVEGGGGGGGSYNNAGGMGGIPGGAGGMGWSSRNTAVTGTNSNFSGFGGGGGRGQLRVSRT